MVKNPLANAGDTGSIPGVGEIPRRRKWQPTLVFLPGKSHGQRSLEEAPVQEVSKESEVTWQLNNKISCGAEESLQEAAQAGMWVCIVRGS